MRINRNTILNYINNPQLFEDKEKEEIRNELARQGIQQEREKQYYIKEIERLNNIIKEAINYIKEESWFCYKDNEEVIDRTPVEKLLEILGDNDENI